MPYINSPQNEEIPKPNTKNSTHLCIYSQAQGIFFGTLTNIINFIFKPQVLARQKTSPIGLEMRGKNEIIAETPQTNHFDRKHREQGTSFQFVDDCVVESLGDHGITRKKKKKR